MTNTTFEENLSVENWYTVCQSAGARFGSKLFPTLIFPITFGVTIPQRCAFHGHIIAVQPIMKAR